MNGAHLLFYVAAGVLIWVRHWRMVDRAAVSDDVGV